MGNESTAIRESHARGITRAAKVQRLVEAHRRVRKALDEDKAPRLAAKILAEELRGLAKANEPFWNDIRDAGAGSGDHRRQDEVSVGVSELIEADARIFGRFGIDESQSAPIIALVYAGPCRAEVWELGVQPETLPTLRHLLSEATDFICELNTGPVRHVNEWLVSWHGARFLAAAAICLASAAALVPATLSNASAGTSAMPELIHDSACWVSIRAGVLVMTAELEGILSQRNDGRIKRCA